MNLFQWRLYESWILSLAERVAMQIDWNEKNCLRQKRVQLLQHWFKTPIWPLFHCLRTSTFLSWYHLKMFSLYNSSGNLSMKMILRMGDVCVCQRGRSPGEEEHVLDTSHPRGAGLVAMLLAGLSWTLGTVGWFCHWFLHYQVDN